MARERKKTWLQKVKLVQDSFARSSKDDNFARIFYENLFFLSPKIREYFKDTDFHHQQKALLHGLEFLMHFSNVKDENAKLQIIRIAKSHSASGMKIHPHDYYYWIEALIMTGKELDPKWYDGMEFYWREVVSMPVSFIVSQYFKDE